ncbi:Hypothetical_protein [Hexamita inflata]|uniref:Hypothetical_protein n=1 Tax=Hexamita inflata TaxID=28002 RepID=A0AA86RF93_9EUKA|nr:Hypothetical protein HINF_LOCUS64265 [Hexamita inflata]
MDNKEKQILLFIDMTKFPNNSGIKVSKILKEKFLNKNENAEVTKEFNVIITVNPENLEYVVKNTTKLKIKEQKLEVIFIQNNNIQIILEQQKQVKSHIAHEITEKNSIINTILSDEQIKIFKLVQYHINLDTFSTNTRIKVSSAIKNILKDIAIVELSNIYVIVTTPYKQYEKVLKKINKIKIGEWRVNAFITLTRAPTQKFVDTSNSFNLQLQNTEIRNLKPEQDSGIE